MISRRLCAMLAALALLTASGAVAKKKKKKADQEPPTQVLELPKELPTAVAGELERMSFRVTPLSAKGLLSQQVRDAVKELLRDPVPPLKIRAYVAGSGDLRRVPTIISDLFDDKHLPLPAVSVVQVGALPLAGAQVVLEATELARKPQNPQGLLFLANQETALNEPLAPLEPLVKRSLERLHATLTAAGLGAEQMLRVTCFATSLDDADKVRPLVYAAFPRAAVNYMQFVRAPAQTIASCEGVARLNAAPEGGRQEIRLPGSASADAVALGPGRLAMTGIQLGFGTAEADLALVVSRLDRALETVRAARPAATRVNVYSLSRGAANRLAEQRTRTFGDRQPMLYNVYQSEGLASPDALFGIEVEALAQ
jgi:enamine deaminase RidA (YjgF/YER057c/UK114 family)